MMVQDETMTTYNLYMYAEMAMKGNILTMNCTFVRVCVLGRGIGKGGGIG